MSRTITVRLAEKLAAWLERATTRSGALQEKPRDPNEENQGFLRLAGTVDGPEDLSRHKGFSRS